MTRYHNYRFVAELFGIVLLLSRAEAYDVNGRTDFTELVVRAKTGESLKVFKTSIEPSTELAIIFLHGDLSYLAPQDSIQLEKEKATLANTMKILSLFARKENIIVYNIARPGFYGSDGDRRHKLSREHYLLTAQAIDELIKSERLRHVALVGHSGGSRSAMAYTILSGNPLVKCYTMSSGNYVAQFVTEYQDALRDGVVIGKNDLRPQRPTIWFDITPNVDRIPVIDGRKFFFLADKRDRVTPSFLSETLAQQLRERGHTAVFVEESARGVMYHDLGMPALHKAASCLRDERTFDLPSPRG